MIGVKSNGRRPTRREASREATRAQVLEAAHRLFVAGGYRSTPVARVAREAGVAVQTLYNSVGGKAALLAAVFLRAASGPEAPRPVPEFMRERTRRAEDAGAMIRLLAGWFAEVHGRMANLWKVIDEAAAHDSRIAAFARRSAHRRLRNYGEAATELKRRGAAADMGRDEVAALIWAIGHPVVHRTLVGELGWSPNRYRAWVETALGAALGPAPGAAHPGPAIRPPPSGRRAARRPSR